MAACLAASLLPASVANQEAAARVGGKLARPWAAGPACGVGTGAAGKRGGYPWVGGWVGKGWSAWPVVQSAAWAGVG